MSTLLYFIYLALEVFMKKNTVNTGNLLKNLVDAQQHANSQIQNYYYVHMKIKKNKEKIVLT